MTFERRAVLLRVPLSTARGRWSRWGNAEQSYAVTDQASGQWASDGHDMKGCFASDIAAGRRAVYLGEGVGHTMWGNVRRPIGRLRTGTGAGVCAGQEA